jgi:LmbE family N-acetylglucosaminyl deacetylase
MTGSPPPRRLAGVAEAGAYDAVYVSTYHWDAPISCAGRLVADRQRGQRSLVVTAFEGAEAGAFGADHLALGFPRAKDRRPTAEPVAATGLAPDHEALIANIARSLEEVFRRARPRALIFPLGVGEHIDSLITHEAALRTFHAGAGRDVYLYEERPEAFVSGSVRIRLAQMGARLPPAASRVTGEGGLLRLLIRTQTVPRLRDSESGLARRAASAREAVGRWARARSWRPLRALGPRLQPLVLRGTPASLDEARSLVRAASAGFGARAAERLLALGSDHARRLCGAEWAERFWLLLPEREGAEAAARVEREMVS